ncbi:MAG: hypothetical protein KAR39_09485, partial [Thermoplasmata archaeon]|nr:hypothetical protein [Thermoplasmata archaeon]
TRVTETVAYPDRTARTSTASKLKLSNAKNQNQPSSLFSSISQTTLFMLEIITMLCNSDMSLAGARYQYRY